ncbi:MAG: glycosyl transferase, family 9 [Bacteroidetes bacterium]|jgi:lipopolysaccharide heptosyltransferase II|nr:glycosyl transferase, family 9 [Bacteroidota bacterium]
MINVLARFLGFILRIDHSLDKPFKTIVVAKYVGLGSIIQATPLLQTLRKKFPAAKIVFVSVEGNSALLKHIPEIDEVITISDKSFFKVIGTTFKLVSALWKLKPELFIDLEFYSNYSSIVTTLSKSTNRLGFYKQDKTYRKGVYNYLVPFSIDVPISETYLQFAKMVKCEELIRDLKIELKEDLSDSISKKIIFEKNQKYIAVNPNASDLRLERRWPKEYYITTIKHILAKYPSHNIVLIGNKIEADYVNEIETQIGQNQRLINSAGKLSLSELIYLISHADLMLTNDTGPMHIAFAVGTKTISLFGPCSPLQYGGLKNGITFYKKTHCSPCVHTHLIPPCKGDNQCMKQISEKEVCNAVDSLIF